MTSNSDPAQEQRRRTSLLLFGYQQQSSQLWKIFIIMGVATHFLLGLVHDIHLRYWFQQTGNGMISTLQWGLIILLPIEILHCLMSLIVGRYNEKLGGAFRLFHVGFILMGLAIFFNGFIQHIYDERTLLFVVAFGLGLVRVVGNAAVYVMSLAVITFQYAESIGTCIGILQLIRDLAEIFCSKRLSDLLYTIGGVSAPFALFGGLLLFFIPLSFIILRNYDINKKQQSSKSTDLEEEQSEEVEQGNNNSHSVKHGLVSLLKLHSTHLSVLLTFSVTFSLGYFKIILISIYPYKGSGHEDELVVFYRFLEPACMVVLPVFGFLCDKKTYSIRIMIGGLSALLLGSIISGPIAIYISIVWLDMIGLTLLQIGGYAVLISSFVLGLNGARKHGFPLSVPTNALVIGLLDAGGGLGSFLGPTFAGILIDAHDYNAVYLPLIVIFATVFLVGLLEYLKRKRVTGAVVAPRISQNTLSTEC